MLTQIWNSVIIQSFIIREGRMSQRPSVRVSACLDYMTEKTMADIAKTC